MCGAPFTIRDEVPFDPRLIVRGDRSLWRYRKFLPLEDGESISLGEGSTPLIPASADQTGLLFKCDYMLPTGSFKDRGSTLSITRAAEICRARGIKGVTEDSSGNAGLSVAAYCARAGLDCEVFVPESVNPAKARLIKTYGAKLRKIPGPREVVSEAASRAHPNPLYVGHVYDPYFIAGIETLAFEIAEESNWSPPGLIFCPVSAGTLILGLMYGFERLMSSDTIRTMPTIVGVQTVEVSPVHAGLHGTSYSPGAKFSSIADALVSTRPARLTEMIEALRKHSGTTEIVAEAEIVEAHRYLARRGFLVEPSSAVAYGGLLKSRRQRPEASQSAIVILTGSGLKALHAITRVDGPSVT